MTEPFIPKGSGKEEGKANENAPCRARGASFVIASDAEHRQARPRAAHVCTRHGALKL